MTRAISPPDATWLTGWRGVEVLAEKRKLTLSCPLCPGSVGVMLTPKRTLGMPSGMSFCCMSFSMSFAALARRAVSTSARLMHSARSVSSCACNAASASSLFSMFAICCRSASRCSISSPTLSAWYFFCKSYILSSLALTASSSDGSKSMLSSSELTSAAMSFSSMYAVSMRCASSSAAGNTLEMLRRAPVADRSCVTMPVCSPSRALSASYKAPLMSSAWVMVSLCRSSSSSSPSVSFAAHSSSYWNCRKSAF